MKHQLRQPFAVLNGRILAEKRTRPWRLRKIPLFSMSNYERSSVSKRSIATHTTPQAPCFRTRVWHSYFKYLNPKRDFLRVLYLLLRFQCFNLLISAQRPAVLRLSGTVPASATRCPPNNLPSAKREERCLYGFRSSLWTPTGKAYGRCLY
jgi:hypothetical protein